MNETLLIELIKIIKNSKKAIVINFENEAKKTAYVDFDKVLQEIEKHTKNLANTIKKEAQTFNKNYESEEQMIDSVKNSFSQINKALFELLTIYKEIKNSSASEEIQKLLSLKVIEKILNDYMLWCEKLENALLGIGNDEVIFVPNIINESKIINYIANNTKQNDLNCWIPFLGGIGLGFLLDDE